MFVVMVLLASLSLSQPMVHSGMLQPIDLHQQGTRFFMKSIDQLESSGGQVFLRSISTLEVIEIDAAGKVLNLLGRSGSGPGEWGSQGVIAITLYKHELWGYGLHSHLLNGYENNRLFKSIDISAVRPSRHHATSNVFGISEHHIVLPSSLGQRYLAEVYDKNGNHLGHAGELGEDNSAALQQNPFANDTMWLAFEHKWFAVFKFLPLIAIYDRQFELEGYLNLNHPWIHEAYATIIESSESHSQPPLFSDVKIYKRRLYAMCRGRLVGFNLKTGGVETMVEFIGKGADFGVVANKPLSLQYFCFLADGTLLLAHPMLLWNHDLWKVNLPIFAE